MRSQVANPAINAPWRALSWIIRREVTSIWEKELPYKASQRHVTEMARITGHKKDSHLVIAAVPLNESCDALLHRHAWAVAHIGDEVGDVRFRVGHIARLQRQHLHVRLAPQALLQYLDIAQKFDGLLVADVVDPIGRNATDRRIRGHPAPCGVDNRRLI